MVLTKSELINSLQHEVRVVLHLAGKIDRTKLDYRPTPRQRSTIELLKYLSMMGPTLVRYALSDTPDPALWTTAEQAAKARDFDQTLAARPRAAPSSSTWCSVGARPTARNCSFTSRPAVARSWER